MLFFLIASNARLSEDLDGDLFNAKAVIIEGAQAHLGGAAQGIDIGSILTKKGRCIRTNGDEILAGDDCVHLPHVIQAMPLCFLPLVASWERFPVLRRSLASLAAAAALVFAALRIGGWHYAYAAFPPLPACRAWSAGVLIPPHIAADLKTLEEFLAAAPPPADGSPLTLTSYPSALPNYLTGVASPLRRFTFYFETPPELTRRSPLVLVLNEGGATAGELPFELRETYVTTGSSCD